MSPEQVAKLLPIIKAYSEGKTIQFDVNGKWKDQPPILDFICDPEKYRIKPEKKKGWINIYLGNHPSSTIHPTKEAADGARGVRHLLDTIEIEWEDNAN